MTDTAKFTVKLFDKVSKPARSAEKALGRFRDAAGKMRAANGRALGGGGKGGMFGGLGGALDVFKGNLLTAAATKVAGLAADVAGATAELVTFGQNSRLAFANLSKYGAPAEAMFDHSRALAKRFGLDVIDTTKQYKKFLALQFTPKDIDGLIRMGADLRALGTDAEGVQGVFMALGQIKGKGRFQGEEMLQLAERGISTVLVQEEIGKLLGGKSTDQVQKLQQGGKITADVALKAIENAINRKLGQGKLGESGAKFADQTIEGMLGRIKSIGQDAGVSMVDRITAPVTKLISGGLGKLETFLASPAGAAAIDKIATALGHAAEFTADLAKGFGSAFGAGFEKNIKPMMEAFSLFGDGDSTAKSLGKALGEVASFSLGAVLGLAALGGAVSTLLGPVWAIGKAIVSGLIDPLAKIAADIFMWISDVVSVLGDSEKTLGDKAWELAKSLMSGFANGIGALISLPIDAIKSVGSSVVDALKDVLDIHSPSRVTRAIGANVARGLAVGADSQSGSVAASGERMAGAQLRGLDYGPAMSSLSRPASIDGGGFGSAPITVHLTTEVNGVGGDPEEVGRIAARESRRELESFFRQLALEG